MFRLALLAWIGCTPPDPATPAPAATAQLAPPGSLTLSSGPWLPGEPAVVTVEGASPGDLVGLAASPAGWGQGPCPQALGGLCLDLAGRVRVMSVTSADTTGRVQVSVQVPTGWSGGSVFLQAASPGPPPATSPGLEVQIGAGYHGGWPEQPAADLLPDPGLNGAAGVGERVPRLIWPDQFGDEVDLYDFSGHDVPIVLHLAAANDLTDLVLLNWIRGAPFSGALGSGVPDAVASGHLYWVTLLVEGHGGSTSLDGADALALENAVGGESLPILAAPSAALLQWTGATDTPSLFLLEHDLSIVIDGAATPWIEVADELALRYP